jgi:hypothetical protein
MCNDTRCATPVRERRSRRLQGSACARRRQERHASTQHDSACSPLRLRCSASYDSHAADATSASILELGSPLLTPLIPRAVRKMACADWRAVARAAAACDTRAIESAALGSFARLYCADFCADSAVAAPSEEIAAGIDDGEEATSGDLASVDPVRAAKRKRGGAGSARHQVPDPWRRASGSMRVHGCSRARSRRSARNVLPGCCGHSAFLHQSVPARDCQLTRDCHVATKTAARGVASPLPRFVTAPKLPPGELGKAHRLAGSLSARAPRLGWNGGGMPLLCPAKQP